MAEPSNRAPAMPGATPVARSIAAMQVRYATPYGVDL
jgi:hypothetical protein